MGFEEKSYEKHAERASDTTIDLPSAIKAPGTVDAWRHTRMLELLNPIVNDFADATWLTLGDARYGADAHMLMSLGADTTASNISDTLLEISSSLGHIGAYSRQNAEAITYDDASFDFVVCKEAYHHFPRPPIAFYEMLRVAREGAILIEPSEGKSRLLDFLREVVKSLLRTGNNSQYEKEGNYVYRTEVREIQRAMLALNMPTVAFHYFNDFFVGRFSSSRISGWSLGFAITRLGISVQNILSRLHLMSPGLICVIAFNQTPSEQLCRQLKRSRFQVVNLPRNPYAD